MILVEPQSVDENLVNSGVRQSDLNERLGIMTAEMLSRSRLSAIIEKFELYRNESGSMQRSEIIELMRSYISVDPVLSELEGGARKKDLVFSTFRITFRHENKYVAAQVAQEIANSFIDANIESRTEITSKSLSFMRDEIGSLSGSLAVVEKSISAIKAESAGSLPEEFAGNQRLLQFGMADLRDAQRILSGAESDASYWKAQALTASTMSGGGDQNSPSYRLQSLELQRGSLLAKGFTKKHPDVVQADAEIALLQSQLAGGAAGEGDEDVAPKSVGEQNARSEQGRAELRAKSAQEDIDRLRVSIAEVERRIGGTASVAEKLDALSRQYDHLSHSYQDFSNRLQQASVQADLERRQLGEKFRILETAEPAPQPSSPNRLLLLSLGTIMGLALGGGIGLISEVADSSVHTSNELQAALGIPVLISVPNIMLESDRAMRSRRILRESLAAAFVVAFVLVGGVTTYYVVNVMGGADSDATPAAEESESTSAMIDLTSRAARG
jgi:uncharacterized protein involved in exopolysaccharide biosynthesis